MNLRSDHENIIPVIERPSALIHKVSVKGSQINIPNLVRSGSSRVRDLTVRAIHVRRIGQDVVNKNIIRFGSVQSEDIQRTANHVMLGSQLSKIRQPEH